LSCIGSARLESNLYFLSCLLRCFFSFFKKFF
jgi:hypothetical protein